MATYDYDVIVVGAGPAGSAAACFSAKEGCRVLLIDKKDFPRDKLCSGGLSPKAMQCLDNMGGSDLIESGGFYRITGVRISSPDGTKLEGPIPATPGLRDYGYVVPRLFLDEILRAHAVKNGVKFRRMNVSALALTGNTCRGVVTAEGELTSRITVLATGASRFPLLKRGSVAQGFSGRMYAVEARYENVADLDHSLEIYYHEKLLPGYFWIFPEAPSRANMGLGVWVCEGSRPAVNLRRLYDEILNSNARAQSRLGHAKVVSEAKVWTIPFRTPDSGLEIEGLLPAGDAGGLGNPFTGEGIYYALESGRLAAMAAVRGLNGNPNDASQLYADLCAEHFNQDLEISGLLRDTFKAPRSVNHLCLAATNDSDLERLVIGAVVNVTAKAELLERLRPRRGFALSSGRPAVGS